MVTNILVHEHFRSVGFVQHYTQHILVLIAVSVRHFVCLLEFTVLLFSFVRPPRPCSVALALARAALLDKLFAGAGHRAMTLLS